jgi:hypothetical protein
VEQILLNKKIAQGCILSVLLVRYGSEKNVPCQFNALAGKLFIIHPHSKPCMYTNFYHKFKVFNKEN